ncbi:MAG: AAA family ATPase [Elusimicrobia bacterium]|nr:AAA family ATPase [Elusimicrobiota bacterium]
MRGLVLGKFLPPHRGHVYLVEFAQRYADRLTVVVGSLKSEPIPGELRCRWLRELFPNVEVLHLADENPQDPSEDPRFWDIWRASLERVLPAKPDLVFASEPYGLRLAQTLGARFVPVDPARAAVPVSARAIRADPFARWAFLPRCVRPHYAKRVCVFGPESTGKTTLARALAARLSTVWVPEYARAYLEAQGGELAAGDIPHIARGQRAAEDALARDANRVLVCDTDLLSTVIWSDTLFGSCPDWIRDEARLRRYDLTFLLDVDVPWVRDPVRYLPEQRRSFFERCRRELELHGRRYVVLSGPPKERLAEAARQARALLRKPPRVRRTLPP